jgi:hypothetical protein
MILLLGLVALFLLVTGLFYYTDNDWWMFLSVILGVVILVASICLPCSYYATHGHIAEFNSVKDTLRVARDRGESIENFALQMRVIDSNKWLASTKYWNSTLFDSFIPDEIERLEPIR